MDQRVALIASVGLVLLLAAIVAMRRSKGYGAQAVGIPTATSATQYAQIASDVSTTRGLPAKTPVPPQFLDQAALTQFLVDNFNRNYLPLERETDQKMFEVLGIVQPGQIVYDILMGILQEQAIGVYDQDVNVLNLINSFPALQQFTYAHEYAHALQDQYFNLDALQPKLSDNDDRDLGILAVLEGDAALAQNNWAQQPGRVSQQDFQRIANYPRTRLDAAPLYIREQLTFPYIKGPEFVQYLLQTGGQPALNAALSTAPPDSTAQILHPAKYTGRVKPVNAALGDLAAAWGNGWRMVRTNVMGEENLLNLLKQHGIDSPTGANGWAGDQYQLLEKESYMVWVLNSVWDTPADAHNFQAALSQAMARRFPRAQVRNSTTTRQTLYAPGVGTSDIYIAGPEARNVIAIVTFLRPQ